MTTTPASWNSALERLGGHLLQSWQWGDFKSKYGWEVERVSVGGSTPTAMATILFRRRGPLSLAYIPRGPAFATGDGASLRDLFREIDVVCRARHAIQLIVELDRSLPFTGTFKQAGFVRGPEHVQPGRTVKVSLLDDDALLAQMHQKTRYSVRLAERRGVEVVRELASPESSTRFYRLLHETSHRNQFGIHDERYYADFLQAFGERALLVFALADGEPAAALIAARFGQEAIYMYGASSTEHRAHGAAFALQFEAMRWARAHGCVQYDLWGIPETDPKTATESGDRVMATKGSDWGGLYKFKVGFGGSIVSYPPTMERRYHPFISLGFRRLYANRSL